MDQPLDVIDGLTITPKDLATLLGGVITTFTPAGLASRATMMTSTLSAGSRKLLFATRVIQVIPNNSSSTRCAAAID
ncbi:MAG TPA: hypothetical protein VNF68_12805 [Candidatus Baltobacteraceae bacterium]|nr:hypothetical protein [Candidatus Baltobacteraceae bacterium]